MNPIEKKEKSLFEQIGGMAAIDAAVEIFYTRVMADDSISHFFRWTDMMSQHAKQKTFLAMAFGAPVKYSGKDMRQAHAHLVKQGLTHIHFDAVMGHLTATLEELNVPSDLINRASRTAEDTRHDVLGIKAA